MATIKKTTIRRYNGTDWDSIYLSTASDIVVLGQSLTVADELNGYSKNDVIAATESVYNILEKVINRLQYLDKSYLPTIADGSSITALAASKITGKLANSQLPDDVHGNFFTGVTDSGKDDTAFVANLKIGDIVKTTEGKVYGVKAITDGVVTWIALSDDAATVAWNRVTGRPTTVTNDSADASDASKLYLTNVVLTGDLIDTSAGTTDAGKAVKLNSAGKLGFDITGDAATLGGESKSYFATKSWADGIDTTIGTDSTAGSLKGRIADLETAKSETYTALNLAQVIAGTGTLPLAVIPKGAQERLYEVSTISVLADKSATGYPTDAGNGDTILAADTQQMYYVKDETKLGTANYEQGIAAYQAGKASSVEWANVLNKPTAIKDYASDAVDTSDLVTSASAANAGKILVLNSQGKLDVDITGDADTLDGHDSTYFATKSWADGIDTAIGDDATAASIKGRIKALETTVGDASSGLVKAVADNTAAIGVATTGSETGIYKRLVDLEAGTTISNINLNNTTLTGTVSRTNLPSDVGGKVWTGPSYTNLAAAKTALASETNVNNGDLVKTANGNLYMIVDSTALSADASYVLLVGQSALSVAWSQLTDIPTTIIKSGSAAAGQILLSNAVISDDVVSDAINATTNAGDTAKSGKLVAVNPDGKLHADVTHLGGHAAQYYEFLEVNSVEAVSNAVTGQMVLVPAT